jgi:hypothetical protein
MIEAPDFCPYKELDFRPAFDTIQTVSPSMCPLCKLCQFAPNLEASDSFLMTSLSKEEMKLCNEYLLRFNSKLAKAISDQVSFLLSKGRATLAILVTATILENTLQYAIKDSKKCKLLFYHYTNHEEPLCYISGSPVYFSRKLTKSSIQVVGEAEWK